MPISSNAPVGDKKKNNKVRVKTAKASIVPEHYTADKAFLTIGPALPANTIPARQQLKRSLSNCDDDKIIYDPQINGSIPDKTTYDPQITVRTSPTGTIHVSRTQKARESDPDRICLDRRGLTAVPVLTGEGNLRLLSLQHNLVSKLDGMQDGFGCLVFLDLYGNQIEKIGCLEKLENLRVLLLGKNRIKRIEGLQRTLKLEVLDLHGNLITQVTGLSKLSELKVLNLAGNQIRNIGILDLQGLVLLQELNLRRNKLKKLLGFGETLQLQKLFLSNNEIQSIEDMSSVAKAVKLREVAIDNNPVSLGGECVSFLVSYLPLLSLLSQMQITEQVRKAAMAWRRNKETSNAAFMDLTSDVCLNVHRDEIISNARTNWELLRSQTTKCIAKTSNVMCKDLNTDFVLMPAKSEVKIRGVHRNNPNMSVLPDKKFGSVRSLSLDTESSSNSDLFRLPPILVPIIHKLGKQEGGGVLKKWGSLSSIGPNVDSSSFPTSSASSDSECEKDCKSSVESKSVVVVPAPGSTDTSSTLSTATSGVAGHSSSGSDLSNTTKRNTKSATTRCVQNPKLACRATTSRVKQKVSPPSSTLVQPPPPNKDREQGGDYLIEISGRFLNVYGHGAVRFIDRPWNTSRANDVNTVKFSYINFNNLIGSFSKLKNRFPNINSLIFCETNIYCLGQLNALAEVQGFASLRIEPEGNLIAEKDWRLYGIFRLVHWGLKTINGKEVTDEEIQLANEEYQSLSNMVLWSLPDALLQPLLARLQLNINNPVDDSSIDVKKWLYTADPALKSVVSKEALQWRKSSVSQEDAAWRQKARTHMCNILDTTCETVKKLRLLDQEWSQIFKIILEDILADYSQLDVYMKQKLEELN